MRDGTEIMKERQPDSRESRNRDTAAGRAPLPKMMLAFVVRRCSVDLGHAPTPAEFAAWANQQGTGSRRHCLFGRPITESEAAIILKNQARLVSAKSAAAEEQWTGEEDGAAAPGANVVSLAELRDRLLQIRRNRAALRVKR